MSPTLGVFTRMEIRSPAKHSEDPIKNNKRRLMANIVSTRRDNTRISLVIRLKYTNSVPDRKYRVQTSDHVQENFIFQPCLIHCVYSYDI